MEILLAALASCLTGGIDIAAARGVLGRDAGELAEHLDRYQRAERAVA